MCQTVGVSILHTKEHMCMTVEGVYIVYQKAHVSDSWGCLYCIPRKTCVRQFRVSVLYTKEHMCRTVEGVYIAYQGAHVSDSWGCLENMCQTAEGVYFAYQGAHVSDSWGCLYCIPRSTCVRQLRVSVLYTKEHLCLTLYVCHFIHQIDNQWDHFIIENHGFETASFLSNPWFSNATFACLYY